MPTPQGFTSPSEPKSAPNSPLLGHHKAPNSPGTAGRKWYSSPKLRSARSLWGRGPRDNASVGSDTSSSVDTEDIETDDTPAPIYYLNTLPAGTSEEEKDAVLINAPGKQGAEKYASLMSRESLRQALDDPSKYKNISTTLETEPFLLVGLAKFGQFLANELGAEQLCFWLVSSYLHSINRSRC